MTVGEIPLGGFYGRDKVALVDPDVWEWARREVWFATNAGYVSNATGRLHRRIMRAPRGFHVTFLSGDRLDCRRANLRIVTQAEIARKGKKARGARPSRFKGVTFYRGRRPDGGEQYGGGVWIAQCTINRKKVYLGSYSSEEEAAAAYDAKIQQLGDELAFRNGDRAADVNADHRAAVEAMKDFRFRFGHVAGLGDTFSAIDREIVRAGQGSFVARTFKRVRDSRRSEEPGVIFPGGKRGVGKRVLVDLDVWEWARDALWHVGASGYIRSARKINGERLLSRIIMSLTDPLPTDWPERLVDHRSGEILDNRRANLRLATHRENALNAGKRIRRSQSARSSRFKGVFRRPSGKWGAYLKESGRSRYLGSFATEEAAARAWDAAAAVEHGEFARLNFPV